MTVLIAWAGVDARGPASLYLASDSRISWFNGQAWDLGRKLFLTRTKAHILGFYGDVVFPSQVLAQMVDLIDSELIFASDASPSFCIQQIVESVTASLTEYPESASRDFGIVHGMRQGELMECGFHLSTVNFKNRVTGPIQQVEIGHQSDVLVALGSGTSSFRESMDRWTRSDVGGTSRAVFSALADSIRGGQDPNTGGPPQLVVIYRKGPARACGVVWQRKRWVLGKEVGSDVNLRGTKWHNDLFEVVNPVGLTREKTSQPQPRPHSLEAYK